MIDEIDLIENSVENCQILSNPVSKLYGNSGLLKDTTTIPKNNDVDNEMGFVKALLDEGTTFLTQKNFDQADKAFRRAIELSPDCPEAHNGLGKALFWQNRWDEAFDSHQNCLQLNPHFADAHLSVGVIKSWQRNWSEAITSYRTAISLDPTCAHAYYNLASLYHSLHRFEKASTQYQEAIKLDHPVARAHSSFVLLLTGNFSRGWQEYEYRPLPESDVSWSGSAAPWRGDADIRGKTILLYAEQGLGDTLQFVRYVKKVAALGATVYLQVQGMLKSLLESYPDVAQVFACGDTLPPFDYKCPLMSLPLAFSTQLDSIPAPVSYIKAPIDRARVWAEHLPQDNVPRIGFVWSGNPTYANDLNRSIDLQTLSPIFDGNMAYFFSLQKKPRPADAKMLKKLPSIIDLGRFLSYFSETSAIIANLDLVITVDTAVAHLAGAMGKPVWILLAYTPDFRWLLDRSDSPWYPSVRLFRQSTLGDWANVIDEVRTALLQFRSTRDDSDSASNVLGGENAMETAELRHAVEQKLRAPSLRKQTEYGIEWTPERQICYAGTRQFEHEGVSDITPSHDLARVILAASGELPWFPEGSADHRLLVDFNTTFLENLMNYVLQHVACESFNRRSVIGDAMSHMHIFAHERSSGFSGEIENAYFKFCSGIDQEAVVRFSPYYFALRRIEQADNTYKNKKLAIRFRSDETTNVAGIVKECQIVFADVMEIIGSSKTIYEHWNGMINWSDAR